MGAGLFFAGSWGPVGHLSPRPAHLEATTPTDPPVQKVGYLRHPVYSEQDALAEWELDSGGLDVMPFEQFFEGRARAAPPNPPG